MRFLLDANSLIALLAGTSPAFSRRALECEEDDLAVSAIAFGEVALGSWNRKHPSLLTLDRLSARVPVLPFDHLAAKLYAQLPFRRGSFDRLIAAQALSLDLTLVTANLRDFADVPDLRVENWTL